jgi:hypothetical protein
MFKKIAVVIAWAHFVTCLAPYAPCYGVTLEEVDASSSSSSTVRLEPSSEAEHSSPPRQQRSCGAIFGNVLKALCKAPFQLIGSLFTCRSNKKGPETVPQASEDNQLTVKKPQKTKASCCALIRPSRVCLFLLCAPLLVTLLAQPNQYLPVVLANPTKPSTDSIPDFTVDLSPAPSQPLFGTNADLKALKENDAETTPMPVQLMDKVEREDVYRKLDIAYRSTESVLQHWTNLSSHFKNRLKQGLTQQEANKGFSKFPSQRKMVTLTYGDLFSRYKEIEAWKKSPTPSLKEISTDPASSTIIVKQFHYAIGEQGDVLTTVDLTKCVGMALYNSQTHRGGVGHLAGENIKDLDQYLEDSSESPHSIQQFAGEVAQGNALQELQATLVSGYAPHISYFKAFLEHLGVTSLRVIYNENWASASNNQFDQPTGNIALDCNTGVVYHVKNPRDIYSIQGVTTFHSGGAPLPFKRQETSKDQTKATSKASSAPSSKPPLSKKKRRNIKRRGPHRNAQHDEL